MGKKHNFLGKWITDDEFCTLAPRNVFHKQLEVVDLPCDEHRNRHILFRKEFDIDTDIENAKIYISADDYYKLYINGKFVGQGPAPSYHFNYNYNIIDVSGYLKKGKNLIAVHTLYQGLINRVWQSGDNRHGLIMDLEVNSQIVLCSDDTFKTAVHSAYTEMGVAGYDTQFLERYDSNAREVGFERLDFDDGYWANASLSKVCDHSLTEQKTSMLTFEKIVPAELNRNNGRLICDFGSNYVGYICATVKGNAGDVITVRCGQELDDDYHIRYDLRACCRYEEEWVLTDGKSTLDWFDYKAFRYAELILPQNVELVEIYLVARHYPFELKSKIKPEYRGNKDIEAVWNLCVNSQKNGVQEVIQDCMEREKGFYLGDGCYTSLVHMVLTHDDSIVRKLIDDAFSTDFITDTLVTCMDCSFMQEIAEYPLMLIFLIMWHYNFKGDKEYLKETYPKAVKLLEAYRAKYEKDFLLRNLDKWCVVEWPANYQHGYDVDITEGKVCEQAHVSINSYYIKAIKVLNKISQILGSEKYRDEAPLIESFLKAFYDSDKHLFKDGEFTDHISLVGNSFPYSFGLCPDEECKENILNLLKEKDMSSLSLFCVFPMLIGLAENGRYDLITDALLNDGMWKRMLSEDATTTFEGWGKDCKWNTSLFHLTFSYAAIFIADVDLDKLLDF